MKRGAPRPPSPLTLTQKGASALGGPDTAPDIASLFPELSTSNSLPKAETKTVSGGGRHLCVLLPLCETTSHTSQSLFAFWGARFDPAKGPPNLGNYGLRNFFSFVLL